MTYTKSKDAGSFSMAFYKHIFFIIFWMNKEAQGAKGCTIEV